MKRMMPLYSVLIFSFVFFFCSNPEQKKEVMQPKASMEKIEKHPNFNNYWYAGKAEITSYQLSQVRYGEIHQGIAVNIFVTEDFLPEKQVKADAPSKKNIPILKLNSTKKFTTGIYPYSLMNSTFSPIDIRQQAIKISFSAQEWCGNTFVQLNNTSNFKIDFYSYFESNSDRNITLSKDILENEIWTQIRISPTNLPTGKLQIIPSFEYLSLHHKKFTAYEAIAALEVTDHFIVYSIKYPILKRTLIIKATKEFPYTIESWEETISSRGKMLTTKAAKIKTIQSAYWSKNRVSDIEERKELGLE
ncbi:septum formation inhibitor Maf [Polaribacter litorisediminis]|uniref:septum formation inhibitor Maf n=1 Tax=Polaribacter litorisediminis TaxID=1908341 RepID=UPI001CC132AD|nr:septum formation inhibitor Maf [Polaribacter litorisediminis]UAM96711.1 septum formation inhibitor Maf [Polaribacter litorisediminis]